MPAPATAALLRGMPTFKVEYECIRRVSIATGWSLRQTELELAAFVNGAGDN